MRMTVMEPNRRSHANLREVETAWEGPSGPLRPRTLRAPVTGQPGVTRGSHRRIRSAGQGLIRISRPLGDKPAGCS